MNLVEPIRDKKKIEDKKVYLKGNSLRDYALFVVGINVALRISDLLKLTWGYHAWQKGFSPALTMETLNHSNLT